MVWRVHSSTMKRPVFREKKHGHVILGHVFAKTHLLGIHYGNMKAIEKTRTDRCGAWIFFRRGL